MRVREKPSLTNSRLTAAQDLLLAWYQRHGRTHLPWRATRDPYRIVVSEAMLAQTQVQRVLPKFESFVQLFPTLASLASASTAEVLRAWRGLGYNSRAVRLKALAMQVIAKHDGVVPHEAAALRRLPGIGPYTVAAVRAFAYDKDDAAFDTNVRRIVHRVFFGVALPERVPKQKLNATAARLVPERRGHDWNSALMDLGSSVCTARAPKCLICPLRPVCAAAPIDASELEASRRRLAAKASARTHTAFKDTARFVRGRIIDRLRDLPVSQSVSLLDLQSDLRSQFGVRRGAVKELVEALRKEGLVKHDRGGIALAD